MKSTLRSLVVRSFLVTGFVLGAVQGCGSSGSSSGTDLMSVCMQGCTKIVPCLADAGVSETVATCVQNCVASGSSGSTTCTNESAIVSAAQACAAKTTCTELEACGATIPKCQTSSGSAGTNGAAGTNGSAGKSGGAGTSGSAGSTGAGGAGTAADCSTCTKAANCCTTAGLSSAVCGAIPSASACTAATGTAQTGDIATCMGIISYAATMGVTCP